MKGRVAWGGGAEGASTQTVKAAPRAAGNGSVGSKKESAGAWGNDERRVERNAGEQGSLGAGRCNEGAERGSAGRGYQAAEGR